MHELSKCITTKKVEEQNEMKNCQMNSEWLVNVEYFNDSNRRPLSTSDPFQTGITKKHRTTKNRIQLKMKSLKIVEITDIVCRIYFHIIAF